MKLNRRGEMTLAISLLINGLTLLGVMLWGIDHLNWVGDGYCFKSSLECYFPKLEGK